MLSTLPVPCGLRLAEAMVRYPATRTWLLKIDDEHMGNGHAYFRRQDINGANEVLDRCVALHGCLGPFGPAQYV